MIRGIVRLVGTFALAAGAFAAGSGSCGNAKGSEPPPPAAVAIAPATAVEQPVVRFIRATGTLAAEEDADVAAETAGRVVATPIERGARVAQEAELVRILATET